MDANELFKMAFNMNTKKAAEVRAMSDEEWRQQTQAIRQPSLAEMLGRAKKLSRLVGVLAQSFDDAAHDGEAPTVRKTMAECEELAYALRSDLERMTR